jgi:predicted ATPase
LRTDDWARVLSGWARGRQGSTAIRSSTRHSRADARRARARRPYYLGLLAETLVAAGRYGPAAAALDDGINIALSQGDRCWLPELLRQKAALQPGPSQKHSG